MPTLIVYFLILVNQNVYAGDYHISITDDLKSCSELTGSRTWPSYTPKVIAKDILSYFKKDTYRIKNLPSAVVNGHFQYCGTYDPIPIYDAFVEICKIKLNKNKSKLPSFLKLVDKKKLIYRLEDEMQKGTASPSELNHLEKCRSLLFK